MEDIQMEDIQMEDIQMEDIRKGLSRMPCDVINLIIFYTFEVQPKHLLEDIENISKSKEELFRIYKECWDDDEDRDWLINDIFGYANMNKPTMLGYQDNFYNIFSRNVMINNRQDVVKYVINMEEREVDSQINTFLGLLTVEERMQLILSNK